MKIHLEYVEPERSAVGGWKHGVLYSTSRARKQLFPERRARLKEFGMLVSKAGVMTDPVNPVKVVEFALGVHDGTYGEAWGFNVRNLIDTLLGQEWKNVRERDEKKFFLEDTLNPWEHVAWADEDWWIRSPERYLHQLHQSTENPANVAYGESLEKLKLERYTSTKPGRYLTRFFGGENGVLSEAQIKYWAERQAARACPAELKFIAGTDKDGWVRVYRDGPSSCMQGEDSVAVYAHDTSVLRLAYLEHAGEIKGRCIVRDDIKEWVRCYPNTNTTENQRWHDAMQSAIEAEGYTHGNLSGVYLDKVKHPSAGRYDRKYVMPYLDSGAGRNKHHTYLSEEGSLLLVGADGECGQQQDGFVDLDGGNECAECGDRIREDEGYYIEGEEIEVCSRCYENEFVLAYGRRGLEETIRLTNAIEVNGNWYDPNYLSDNDIFECESRGEYYHVDDLCMTLKGYVHVDLCVRLDEDDPDGNSYAHSDDVKTTHDGRTIHEDDAVTETINGVDVVFHKDDDIEAYKAENAEDAEDAEDAEEKEEA